MHIISRDSPCYFLTSVAKDRLPIFRTDELKRVTAAALDEAQLSARSSEDTLRFMNGIIGHRVIGHLKEQGHEISLQKLRQETKRRQYRYSLWDHHPNTRLLFTEKMLMERVHYLHQNPVRAGLVKRAEDYLYSSVRCWNGNPREDEPLLMDIGNIKWRR